MTEGKRRVYSAEEYVEHLRGGLADEVSFTGMVRADDDGRTLHFAHPGHCGSWIEVPAARVQSVEHLGSSGCGDHRHAVARITLKPPESEEGRFLLRLAAHQHDLLQRMGSGMMCPNGVCYDAKGVPHCC